MIGLHHCFIITAISIVSIVVVVRMPGERLCPHHHTRVANYGIDVLFWYNIHLVRRWTTSLNLKDPLQGLGFDL